MGVIQLFKMYEFFKTIEPPLATSSEFLPVVDSIMNVISPITMVSFYNATPCQVPSCTPLFIALTTVRTKELVDTRLHAQKYNLQESTFHICTFLVIYFHCHILCHLCHIHHKMFVAQISNFCTGSSREFYLNEVQC